MSNEQLQLELLTQKKLLKKVSSEKDEAAASKIASEVTANDAIDSGQALNGKHGPNHSITYDRTTKFIRLEIHEDPDVVLKSMIEDRAAARDKLGQKVLKETTEDNVTTVHWTLVDQNKDTSLSLLLRLKVEKDANGEIRIAVASIKEGDLDYFILFIRRCEEIFDTGFQLMARLAWHFQFSLEW
ncbi:hypothetical protein TL16_g00604 [Triparma laevis f. inornata]|uniref:Uncharacterized protein n=1 Tax=Triparma laevis f. inornata TaxID=1714386 RepID=A0A9W6ZG52_9STRA|nr:hypothetical protein TL16_g00604 [Triparma laevis f. inornata]